MQSLAASAVWLAGVGECERVDRPIFSPTLRFAFKTRPHVRVNINREEGSFSASTMTDAPRTLAATLSLALEWLLC